MASATDLHYVYRLARIEALLNGREVKGGPEGPTEERIFAMRTALEAAKDDYETMLTRRHEDPVFYPRIQAAAKPLYAYGALMGQAQLAWERLLEATGVNPGAAFVVGPCKSTAINTLKKIKEALG
jgi:hypothetical protein